MVTVFWNASRVILIDYLEKVKITEKDRFNIDLKQKQPYLANKKVLFHQDNSRVKTCLVLIAKIHKLGYELQPNSAYYLDYFLFTNLKKWLSSERFGLNEKVITTTNTYFESLEKTFYLEGIQNWKNAVYPIYRT